METEENSFSTSESEAEINDIDFKNFINTKYNGLITVLSGDSELVVTTTPLILAFHNFNKLGTQLEPWCNQIAKAAKEYIGQVAFAIADFKALSIGAKWNKYNFELLGSRSRPRFFAFDLHGNQYRKDEFLNNETLKEFATLLLKERLFISEPLPQEEDNKRVKIAVGSNLKELLANSKNDIFIVFYANKNQNSKALIPKLEELARLLQHEDLTVVKMNAEENHIPPDFNITSYPRCFYIRNIDKNHYIQYEHEKFAIENLIEFIAMHSTKELECCDRNGYLKEKLRFKTELHLDTIAHIRSLVKNNYKDLIQVITQIEVTEKPLVVAFHNFMRFYDYLEPWCDIIDEVAKRFHGKVNFAFADIGSFCIGEHKFEREFFTENVCPWIFAFDKENNQYRFKEFLCSTTLENFVTKLQQNELPKSDLKQIYANDPLKVGTEEKFNELVLNNNKDVFILFHSKCSYYSQCQQETQEYLASLLQDDENQVVVKIDADAEKPPPYHRICIFPTYIYVTKSHIENRNYWNRDIEDLIKFIAENSRHELKYYDREGYLRREYKRKLWIKPFQSVLTTVTDENEKEKEEETECVLKHKLGNIITTSAFQGLLSLREADEDESPEIVDNWAEVAICKNFDEFVLNSNKDIFLVFYSDFFKDIRQVLDELAKLLSCDDENLVIAKMNTQSYPIPSQYKGIFYPKCIFIPKNDKKNVIEFISQSRTIDTRSVIPFIGEHSSMELTNYDREGILKKRLKTVGKNDELERIFHLADAFDEFFENFEISSYKEDIETFISRSEYNGLLSLICPEKGENIKMFKNPFIVIVHDFKKLKERILIQWSATLLPVLQEFQEQIKFYACDCANFKRFPASDLVSPLVYYSPEIYAMDSSSRMYKRMDENFREFTIKVLRDECFKSEPVPPENSDDLVKKAVGHNFESIVLNNQSDVFVLIYNSEWYEGKEHILLPIAELFEEEDIVFVKTDVSKNYIPLEFSCGGYFFPKTRRNKPLRYNKFNNLRRLTKFLATYATNELKGFDRKGIPKKKKLRKAEYRM